jgi:PAS domain S-box-containing protein
VLAVVLANAAVSYRATTLLAGNGHLVAHTLRVMNELEATLSLMKDAETSYRGYVLTNNPAYLDPYDLAQAEVSSHIDRIAELTKHNPQQQQRIPALRLLTQEKLEFAKRVIGLQKNGNHQAAMAAVNTQFGKDKMDELRQLIADMQANEDRLLEARSGQSRRSLRQAQLAFLLASLLALIFVAAFYFLAKREVRERVQTAKSIKDRESWLDTTLCSIGDAVVATDAAGRVTFINRVAEKLIACASNECKGKTIPEVFPIFDELTGAPAPDPVAKALTEGITGLGENIVLRNRNNEEIPIEDSVAPIFGSDRKIIGVVLVFRDVTTKRMTLESARRSEKLAAAGRLAATIAHEINNPLEAATNLVYLAKHSQCPDEAGQYLDGVDRELARAAHITRKTLGFYRDSAKPAAVNLAAMLQELLAIYSGRIRSKHIRAEVNCPPDLETVALRGELVQIVSNLISNAIDAVDTGGLLRITVKQEGKGIKLEVEDNGAGIPAENQKKIFEPFFTTKQNIGTGLGLWVVKDLIEKQGGTISVFSPSDGYNGGTRFSVFLPSPTMEASFATNPKAS